MKRTIYIVGMLASLALAAPAWAQLSVTRISETNTIKTEEPAWSDGDWFDPALERPMSWPQADSVEYDLWARHSTSEWVNLDYTNLVIAWSIVSATNPLQSYLVATGEVVTATNGHVQFALTPEQSNLRTGRYWSAVTVRQVIGGTNRYIGTLSERALTVRYSAEGANWSYVGASQLDTYLTSGKIAIVNGSLSNYPGVPGGITIVVPTVGGSSANVIFENLDGNGDVGTASNQVARGSDAAAAAAVANAATVAVAVAQSTANAATSAAAVAQSAANAATVSVAALSANFVASSGKWSGVISFAGVTNPQPCGAFYYRGGTDLHAVTGCTSYITYSNASSVAGGSSTNLTVAFNQTNYMGARVEFTTGGSITNVYVDTNGAVVVQSKDETGSENGGGESHSTNRIIINEGEGAIQPVFSITSGVYHLTRFTNVFRATGNLTGAWNGTTFEFTPPMTGNVYEVSVSIDDGSSSLVGLVGKIYKNGSEFINSGTSTNVYGPRVGHMGQVGKPFTGVSGLRLFPSQFWADTNGTVFTFMIRPGSTYSVFGGSIIVTDLGPL